MQEQSAHWIGRVEGDIDDCEVDAEASVDLSPAAVNDIRCRDAMKLVQVAETGADQIVIL